MDHRLVWQETIVQSQILKARLQTTLSQIASLHKITVHQLMVLLSIYNSQVTTIGDVTRELEMLQANASALCKRMELMGYIDRVRNETDIRVVNLQLTDKGKTIVNGITEDLKLRFKKAQDEQIDLQKIKHGFNEFNKLIQVMEGE